VSPVHIAMCVDQGFVMPLAVALASLDDAVVSESVTVHIAHPGLSPETRGRVARTLERIDLEWYAVDERMLDKAQGTIFLSKASMYRLLLAEVLPDDLERVVYVDADTLMRDSLAELMTVDLDGCAVAAVREAASPWAAGPLGPDWRTLGIEPDAPYFNAGVLVIDLVRWRAEGVGPVCLEILRGQQLRWGDQDALNTVFTGRWKELSRKWNLQSVDADGTGLAWGLWSDDVENASLRPRIVHFTGREKPWMLGGGEHFRTDWYAALDRTAWRGWRPEAQHPPRFVSSAIRLGQLVKRSVMDRQTRLPR
jgi:lipopolysaccharide biosynthesis glycosyltransferase